MVHPISLSGYILRIFGMTAAVTGIGMTELMVSPFGDQMMVSLGRNLQPLQHILISI
jgi:hypothetical protein